MSEFESRLPEESLKKLKIFYNLRDHLDIAKPSYDIQEKEWKVECEELKNNVQNAIDLVHAQHNLPPELESAELLAKCSNLFARMRTLDFGDFFGKDSD